MKHRRQMPKSVVGDSLGMAAAQGLNLVAIIAPIAMDRTDLIAPLIIVSAIGTVAAHTMTSSFPGTFPVLINPGARRAAVRSAAGGLTSAAVLAAASALVLNVSGFHQSALIAIGVALFVVLHGAYIMATTIAISRADLRRFARIRICYSVLNVGLTFAVCAWCSGVLALVLAVSLSYGIASVANGLGGRPTEWLTGSRADSAYPETGRIYFVANLPAAAAAGLMGISVQASAATVGFTGAYRDYWAVTLRLVTGVGGAAQQVVAPWFDAHVSSQIRSGQRPRTRTLRLALGVTALLVAGSGTVAIATTGLLYDLYPGPLFENVLVTFAYAGGIMSTALLGRFLLLLGQQLTNLTWSAAKVATSLTCIWIFDDKHLIVALAVAELIFGLAFVLLILGGSRVTDKALASPSRLHRR